MSVSRAILCLLAGAQVIIPLAAQSTGEELRPELGFYIQQGPQVRFELVDSFRGPQTSQDWQGEFAFYIAIALKPVFRRELRDKPDVFRNKYLVFRAGYRYQTSLTNATSAPENRGMLELTPRHRLPWQLVISDRNRGDFRFIQGQPFSTRYRNRVRLERDVYYRGLKCTAYVYDEIFFDTRYNQLTPNLLAFGAEFPVRQHVVFEPYYLRQTGGHSTPANINALGFKLNLYF
jgi:Protein of unknown function (DUF2490)